MWISYSKMQELIFNIPAQKTHVLILNQLSMYGVASMLYQGQTIITKDNYHYQNNFGKLNST